MKKVSCAKYHFQFKTHKKVWNGRAKEPSRKQSNLVRIKFNYIACEIKLSEWVSGDISIRKNNASDKVPKKVMQKRRSLGMMFLYATVNTLLSGCQTYHSACSIENTFLRRFFFSKFCRECFSITRKYWSNNIIGWIINKLLTLLLTINSICLTR